MQLRGLSMTTCLLCCTGVAHWGTQQLLLTLPSFFQYFLGICSSSFLPHHPRAPSFHRKVTTLSSNMPVPDSVSLTQVSNTSCASQPPGSDPGAGLHFHVNQLPSFLALFTPKLACRTVGRLLARGSLNGPCVPCPVSPRQLFQHVWYFMDKSQAPLFVLNLY